MTKLKTNDASEKPRVLLAAYGGGHINIIIPLYRELLGRGISADVIAFTMARVGLKKEGIPFFSYTDFLDNRDKEAIETGKSLKEELSKSNLIPDSETEAYLGIGYQELEKKYGAKKAKDVYKRLGRRAFLPIEFMTRILKKLKPDIVVTTNSPRSEQAMIYAANTLGVPAYCVVDYYNSAEVPDRLGENGYGKKIFVTFDSMKKLLLDGGREKKEIIVAGNPGMDRLASIEVADLARIYREQIGALGKYVILWVKSVLPELQALEAEVEQELMRAYGEDGQIQLVFRPHPNDGRKYTDDEIVIWSGKGESLDAPLSASDLIITINSTVGLEANILEKDVIQVDMVDFKQKIPFSMLKIGYTVKSIKEMTETIELVRNRKIPRHKPVQIPGKSARNIADEILSNFRQTQSK